MRAAVGALAAAVALGGCANDQPVRTRWAELSAPLVQPVAPTLSVSSVEAASPPSKVRDLSERGGAAYVEALAAKIAEPDAFREALAAGIAPGKKGDADQTRLARTLAIGVGKRGYQAGQRFVVARVVIVPIGFAFNDLTQVTSKYSTIDLETVSVQSTTSAKIGIAPEFGNVIEAGEASFSQERKAGTTYVNQARIEALTADFQPGRIEIYQQSAPNEDLTGLVLASVGVRPVSMDDDAKKALFEKLKVVPTKPLDFNIDQTKPETVVVELKLADDKGAPLAAGKASITTAVNTVWMSRPLVVCAGMDYVTRVPSEETARFFDEGRQVVTESEGRLAGRLFVLVPAEEVARPLWGIKHGAGFLEIDTSTGTSPFSFRDPLQASRFASWMTEHRATSVGEKRLWTSATGVSKPFAFGKGDTVRVERLSWSAPQAGEISGPCSLDAF